MGIFCCRRLLLGSAVFLLLTVLTAVPENAVFFGVPAEAASEQVLMAQDLFYNRLSAVDSLTLEDRRSVSYAEAAAAGELPASGVIFYLSIENTNGKWVFSFTGELPAEGKKAEYAKTYDSFYKILTEAGSSIQAVMTNLFASGAEAEEEPKAEGAPLALSIERLAGTWSGEDLIDKIVILRSGRGFAIYENGATMNLTVAVSGSTVTFTQSGRPNASFYPDLPRQIALVSAQNAPPISWAMQLVGENTMKGIKTTLVPVVSNGEVVSAEQSQVDVSWSRQTN